MKTALLEPNMTETNTTPPETLPPDDATPQTGLSRVHPSDVPTPPTDTSVTVNLLLETERGFQQEVKRQGPAADDLQRTATTATNPRPQPVLGPAWKRRQVAKSSVRSLVRATYAQRGQTAQILTTYHQSDATEHPGTVPARELPTKSVRKSPVEDVQHSPRVWAAQMARCGLEIIEGTRPLSQMTRWASPQAYRYLEQRRNAIVSKQKPQPGLTGKTRRVSPVRVLSAHSRATSATTHEAVIVLNDGQRTRAAALTLENHGEQWMIAAIRLG
ncbi:MULTISPECIES: Rv3235 family protein [Mobiluncus]|uniref:Uncharacterized protein n=1 Tax=Mobiluncus holmesii ATCC 35242 TaxID=887899 RepID=E6M1J5_9ACTO|nr:MULTISPECIES: Rv3235 family protein [Mobiluncus]EFU82740.1 hypothetical protein HMPREF0576_0070 [Mobiluncus holmesii ATCC 35242]NMW44083.1 hypothetical protein [Mobiluncus curtisii]NMW83244.1 hypothetical protein [Mobiluncus curtisii]NMW98840.1 hypothetical protein [Mobiluncus curtisii]NMX05809.1 hypothetical protein [Mobiluncus curtisii]